MSSGEKIELLVQGRIPSLVNADRGNEVIQKLNSLLNIRLIEGDSNEISYSENDVVITLKESSGDLAAYSEMSVFICVNGTAQLKTILIKD